MPDKDTIHDLGNLLGVALALVEAMIDGILPTAPDRLEAVAAALRQAADLVREA